ncbi:MAG TPA: ribonuclease PH [Candidatus Nanopelagicaceae bacterium]|nr:ribonuclease PH [Candidatus Nanopelagicaceae bacterium]
MTTRHDGRSPGQVRPLRIEVQQGSWAEGAVLISLGETRVLCTATVEERVPPHRRGTHSGWVTAEYGMLPRATQERSPRERDGRLNGRSQEIQRLVARSLRAAVDLGRLGERTVIVDCDVLHADGGTRTASISGGFVALALACRRLVQAKMVRADPLVAQVAAISVGIVGSVPVVDLDYPEDSRASTDMNLVMDGRQGMIELQGTAESKPFTRDELEILLDLGAAGIDEVLRAQRSVLDASGLA